MKNIFITLFLIPCLLNAQNLIKNGDFESGNTGFTSQYKFTTCKKDSNNCANGAFICSGSIAIVGEPSACNPDWSATFRDHTTGRGKMLVADFASRSLIIWQQTLEMEQGATYRFRVWCLKLTDEGAKPSVVIVVDSTTLSPNFIAMKNEWQLYEVVFVAKKSGQIPLRIKNINNEKMGCDLAIDDIRLEVIKKNPLAAKKAIPKTLPIQWYLANNRLRPESLPILDSLALVLQKNPNLKLTIISHTDTRGSEAANMKLSENRSKRVVDYLVTKGIDINRLTYKGLGETQTLIDCIPPNTCTEAQHQQNRRTEFLIE
jgi:outer membrane protein OmpA-like peptidoglycan-associated protein